MARAAGIRAVLAVGLCLAFTAQAQPADADRGKLLYETHCIRCHAEQMHWRALRRARDYDSLRAQVDRWQGEARLSWSEQDIEAVTRHLNDTIYGFPADKQAGAVGRRLSKFN